MSAVAETSAGEVAAPKARGGAAADTGWGRGVVGCDFMTDAAGRKERDWKHEEVGGSPSAPAGVAQRSARAAACYLWWSVRDWIDVV